jgi:hypothetical protein
MLIDAGENLCFAGYLGSQSLINDQSLAPTEFPYELGARDVFVAQASGSGELQWYSVLGDVGNDEVRGIAADTQVVYAGGLIGHTSAQGDDGSDAVLYALAKTDGSLIWSNPLVVGDMYSTNGFNAVAIDEAGNIYAVGYTGIEQIESVPGVPGYTVGGRSYGQSLQGDLDACVLKVSSTGVLLWAHYLGGDQRDAALVCMVGTNGAVYVGGETCSTGWVSEVNGVLPSASSKAGFLVKLTPDGEHLWSTYLGGGSSDSVSGLAYDEISGRIFAAGTTTSSDFMSQEVRLNQPPGKGDGFVCSITDGANEPLINWSRFYGSAVSDTLDSICVLDDNELVIGGTSPNGSWLSEAATAHSGGQDGYLIVISLEAGELLWSSYLGGGSEEQLAALAARNGVFYAGGMTASEGWVSGGFRETWDDPFGDLLELGFLVRYQSAGYSPDAPGIVIQPQAVTVEEQHDAPFSIVASGTEPLFYQWRVNGIDRPGATAADFTLHSVQLSQDGDLISCLVSNVAGALLSDAVALNVTAIPNGYVQINLTPDGAVADGAAWSIDAGGTWHDSGETVNLTTGVYAIVYQEDIFGWAAPETPIVTTVQNGVTNTLNAEYTQILYSNYRQINGTNVTVFVEPPADATQIYITETLPKELEPRNYAPLQWDDSIRQLRYISMDSTPKQFTYSVTGADGEYQLSGTVNFGSGAVTTVGDDLIVIGATQPDPPPPDIIGFVPHTLMPESFLLTFISVADQQYLIETNAAPSAQGWAGQQQISGQAEQTGVAVPAEGKSLFYRIRIP